MNIHIKTTNLTLSPAISEYVTKRLSKAAKIIGDDPTIVCDVELGKTTGHQQKGEIFKAEVHIVGAGKNLYASAEREDLYSAIDKMRDEITQEVNSTNKKKLSLVRRSGARVKAMVKGLWPF